MPDWKALTKARELDIPEEAIERISGPLDALHSSFVPLLAKLSNNVEPAIILSESAMLGGAAPEK
jgi:hypothetical protein